VSVPITRSFFNGHVSPATPPSSPIPPRALSPGPFDYMERTLSPDTNPSGMTRWNGLLQNFSQGRAAGRNVCDYIPFDAIAPCYLPLSVRTPAWILDQIRGEIPFEMIKLRPGSAICLQDASFRDVFRTPAIPTMFGTIDRMQWREDGYQVATVGTLEGCRRSRVGVSSVLW
jgi:hypothetical protein